jgi:hypothetical protein
MITHEMMSQEIKPGDDEWPSNTHNSRCAARMGRVPVDAPDDPNKITRTTPVVARQTLHRARRPLSNRLLHGVRGRAREVAGGLPRRRCANAPLGDRRARWVADGRARGGSSRRSRSRDPRGCPRRVSRDEALELGRDGRGSTRMGDFETRVCSDALIRKRPARSRRRGTADSWRAPGCFYGRDALVGPCRGCARRLGRFGARSGTWRGCSSG